MKFILCDHIKLSILPLLIFQKALALHHSSLKGRRINVMDSESGKKGKNPNWQSPKQGGKPFGNFKGPQRGTPFRQRMHRGNKN